MAPLSLTLESVRQDGYDASLDARTHSSNRLLRQSQSGSSTFPMTRVGGPSRSCLTSIWTSGRARLPF